jgi:cystathionine gamma-synthase
MKRDAMTASNKPVLHPETLAAQALGRLDPETGALVPPIHSATTYERTGGEPGRYIYTRSDNPTYETAETLIARLEGGAAGLVLASGMSAATAPFMTLAPGDHVILPSVMYWGVRRWINEFVDNWGIDLDYFDVERPAEVKALLRPGKTRILWLETPSNPTWECADIRVMADLAHGAGARLCVDSTCATPVLTNPLALGADLVMHSATKYLNGHSDVLAGALVTARDDEWWQRIRRVRADLGTVLGPNETWLLIRGMRTLHIRVRQCCENAMAIARYLAAHPKVAVTLYPGLPEHPSHEIAARQMNGGFGGMLSIRLADRAAAMTVANSVEVFKQATSLGGVESLIEHRAPVEGPGTPVPDDLLRLSVGIEHIDDLIGDLEQALDRV